MLQTQKKRGNTMLSKNSVCVSRVDRESQTETSHRRKRLSKDNS